MHLPEKVYIITESVDGAWGVSIVGCGHHSCGADKEDRKVKGLEQWGTS